MGLRDIHTGLRQVWGMCIFVLFASHRSELCMSNIFISFTHLRQVWGIFIQVSGVLEEYWYLFYSPGMGLTDIHTGPRWVWGMFTFVLFASHRCEPCMSNICISFTHSKQVWGIFIWVWCVVRNIHIYFIRWGRVWGIFTLLRRGYEQCLYLFC